MPRHIKLSNILPARNPRNPAFGHPQLNFAGPPGRLSSVTELIVLARLINHFHLQSLVNPLTLFVNLLLLINATLGTPLIGTRK